MNEVRFGFVGAGTVAHQMAADLSLVDGARLSAVAARSRQSASRLATLHSAHVVDSFDPLIARDDVDVVYIATPPALHVDQAIRAMRAGKAVLIEKPFALNEIEAKSIVEVAIETNQFCMEAMWSRFLPSIAEIRKRIAAGDLGDVRTFDADFSYALIPNTQHHLFQLPGGGALLDRGVYGVSLALDLFGVPTEIYSRATVGPSGVDEDVSVVMTHGNGVRSTISASLVGRGLNQGIVKGTKATIVLPEPFFATERFSMMPAAAQATGGAAQAATLDSPMVAKVRANPKGLRFFEAAKGLTKAGMNQVKMQNVAAMGAGYAHQILAVVQAMNDGSKIVERMTPTASVEVMRVLDTARSQW